MEDTYHIEFNFLHGEVRVPGTLEDLGNWQIVIANGLPFYVEDERGRHTIINPAQVTYVQLVKDVFF